MLLTMSGLWLCAEPQVLGFNRAARLHFLCPFFVSMDTVKLGLMLQAMKFVGMYEILAGVYEKYIDTSS